MARRFSRPIRSKRAIAYRAGPDVARGVDASRVSARLCRDREGPAGRGILVTDIADLIPYRQLIVELVEKSHLPAMYGLRDYVEAGGLMAYEAGFGETGRRMADDVHEILNGANPGDIPVYKASKFALVINLKAAQTLALGFGAGPIHGAPERFSTVVVWATQDRAKVAFGVYATFFVELRQAPATISRPTASIAARFGVTDIDNGPGHQDLASHRDGDRRVWAAHAIAGVVTRLSQPFACWWSHTIIRFIRNSKVIKVVLLTTIIERINHWAPTDCVKLL